MFYEIGRWLLMVLTYPMRLFFFKTKAYYEDKADFKIHKKQGAMVITNHYNPCDYMVNLFFFLPRKLHIVAAEKAFRMKIGSFTMRFFGGIQANRNTQSLRFIDESVAVLKEGKLLQIFPEGHTTKDGKIRDFYPTYILIALRADSVIIPVVTDGNYGITKQAHILVGKSIHLSEFGMGPRATKEEICNANHLIRERIIAMRETLEELKQKKSKKP